MFQSFVIFWKFVFACWCTTFQLVFLYLLLTLPLILYGCKVSLLQILKSCWHHIVVLWIREFFILTLWRCGIFLLVNGSMELCKEIILVTSGNITKNDSFPEGWVLWQHWLKQSKWLVHPEFSMSCYKVVVVTELQWFVGKVFYILLYLVLHLFLVMKLWPCTPPILSDSLYSSLRTSFLRVNLVEEWLLLYQQYQQYFFIFVSRSPCWYIFKSRY